MHLSCLHQTLPHMMRPLRRASQNIVDFKQSASTIFHYIMSYKNINSLIKLKFYAMVLRDIGLGVNSHTLKCESLFLQDHRISSRASAILQRRSQTEFGTPCSMFLVDDRTSIFLPCKDPRPQR